VRETANSVRARERKRRMDGPFGLSGKSTGRSRASEHRGEIREVVTTRVRVSLFLRFEFHRFPRGFACMCVKLRLRMRGAEWNGQLSRRSFLSD